MPPSDVGGRKLIVGLGNPGSRYEWTRHNIGMHIVQELAKKHNLLLKSEKTCNAHLARGGFDGVDVVLATPKGYMNESGGSVGRLLKFVGCGLSDLLVVVDDIETTWGEIKIAFDGGARGHNGIRSIHTVVGSREFSQLRFGVGRPGGGTVSDYVLEKFTFQEMAELPSMIERSIPLVEQWVVGPKIERKEGK